ncbi:MAG: 3-dehydroquinate synthase [Candidatus Firestonebacteria bacterium]|nr:3-dehydroquinate synthase [Candidatus Firestonebacteria bacterium]
MQTIEVNLKERSYPIHIGYKVLDKIGFYARERNKDISKIVIITNRKVGKYYLNICKKGFEKAKFTAQVVYIPDGEKYKNHAEAIKIYKKLIKFKADRRTTLVALGGGVIGDIVGFVASTYLRGIPFIQVPTSLLAQVDSSVGGKVAINLPEGKNLIGAFYQPLMVFIDCSVLTTLPLREIRAGLSEVIKYGIIKNSNFFNYIDKNLDNIFKLKKEYLLNIVSTSCRIKAFIVEEDETEKGERAKLNFGHTIGHAIEALTKYKKYKHGEAIAIGMIGAMKLAEKMSFILKEESESVENLLKRVGLPTKIKDKITVNNLLRRMEIDKKVYNNTIKFVLTKKIGYVTLNLITDKGLLISVINELYPPYTKQ